MKDLLTIPLGIYEKAIPLQYTWDEKFQIAKQAGFDFIELSIDGKHPRVDRLDWTDEELDEILTISKKHNMPFQTMAFTAPRFYPLGDETTYKQGIEMTIKALRVASRLGIKVMQIPAYDVYQKESTDKTKQRYKESLLDLLPIAEKCNVILAIEVLEDVPHMETIKQGQVLIDEINHPNLKLYADTGNVAYNNHPVYEDLECENNSIVACHVKDAIIHNEHNIPYGEGIVNFNECFMHFRKNDFNGYFVAECWSEEDPAFVPYLSKITEFIRNKIKEGEQK